MIEIRKTELFARWIDDLRDLQARARVQVRIERLAAGNPGDVKPVGEGVSELRIDQVPDIGCTLQSVGVRWSFCWQGVIKQPRLPISRLPCSLPVTCRSA